HGGGQQPAPAQTVRQGVPLFHATLHGLQTLLRHHSKILRIRQQTQGLRQRFPSLEQGSQQLQYLALDNSAIKSAQDGTVPAQRRTEIQEEYAQSNSSNSQHDDPGVFGCKVPEIDEVSSQVGQYQIVFPESPCHKGREVSHPEEQYPRDEP